MAFTQSEEFTIIADQVRNMKLTVSDDDRLKLYGLYKQTTVGDCSKTQRWVVDRETAKLKAWVLVKGTPREDSQAQYIASAKIVLNGGKLPEAQH